MRRPDGRRSNSGDDLEHLVALWTALDGAAARAARDYSPFRPRRVGPAGGMGRRAELPSRGSAAYAEPSYPAVPEPPRTQDDEGVTLGVGLVSRWPITARRVEQLPARHRSWSPVALAASIDHPAGPLHVVVSCLEHGIPYSDDRRAQTAFLAEFATRPELDGPCPVLVMGISTPHPTAPYCARCVRSSSTPGLSAVAIPCAVTLPSSHPSASLEAGPAE